MVKPCRKPLEGELCANIICCFTAFKCTHRHTVSIISCGMIMTYLVQPHWQIIQPVIGPGLSRLVREKSPPDIY